MSTAISNLEKCELTIYPNPSSDIFNLSFESENKKSIIIHLFNAIGEKVFVQDLNNFEYKHIYTFNLSEYSKGIYFLEIVTSNGESINQKLILD